MLQGKRFIREKGAFDQVKQSHRQPIADGVPVRRLHHGVSAGLQTVLYRAGNTQKQIVENISGPCDTFEIGVLRIRIPQNQRFGIVGNAPQRFPDTVITLEKIILMKDSPLVQLLF